MNELVMNYGFFISGLVLFTFFVIRALIFAGGAQVWTQRSPWAKQRQIVLPNELKVDWKAHAKRSFLIILLDATVVGFLFQSGIIHINRDPQWFEPLLTTAALFVWYEIYFYFLHRALHHPSLYWIHRHHHQGRGTSPWTSLSFSLSERLLLLLGAMAPIAWISKTIAVPMEGISLYFLLNYILNVYGHMNVELVGKWFINSPMRFLMNTSTSHSLHHLKFNGNYALFSRLPDLIFGTSFPDYEHTLERVLQGKGH